MSIWQYGCRNPPPTNDFKSTVNDPHHGLGRALAQCVRPCNRVNRPRPSNKRGCVSRGHSEPADTEQIRTFSGFSQFFVQCTKMLFPMGGWVCVYFLKSVRKGLENAPGTRVYLTDM